MRPPVFTSRTPPGVSRPAGGIFYGWWLVGATGFMLMLMAVSVFQGLGTLLVGLERHFGWSRTAMSGAFSLARAEGAVLGPIEGILIDRFGSRRLIIIGYLIMGVGFILFSRVTSLWQFYGAFLIITLGGGLGGWLASIALINNWFIRRRSFAMASAMSGVHLGGFLVPVLALGIDSHGFRWTTLGIGVFLLAVVLPAARIVKDRPEDYGMRPDGDPVSPQATDDDGDGPPASDPDFTAAQALRTPVFYILTIAHLSSSVSIVTLALHLVPKLTDIGFSLGGAGIVVLTYTSIALPVQFAAGYLADRLPKPPVIFAFLLLQAIGILVIARAESAPMAFLFAVLYGIGFGGRIPLLTAIRGEYFGRKAFATIMGLSQFPNNIIMIGAPLFAGYMFDTTGSYAVPFTTFAIANLLGAFLMLFVKRPSALRFASPPQP